MIRIGHRGAAALAPPNTLRSIELAFDAGVDMVELDVRPLADGTLVLAHWNDLADITGGRARPSLRRASVDELRAVAPELATLDEALEVVDARGGRVQLDLKWHGYEQPVVAAVRRHGLVERTLVSSCFARSLRAVAALEPAVERGWTYPFDRHGISRRPIVDPFVRLALGTLRPTLPPRIARLLANAAASVATLHYLVLSPSVVRRCHARGVPVYAWTVDDAALVPGLARMGVDGIITNDPRIFAATL